MVKFMKPGKVVIVVSGRYAGKKAVIVQNYDTGTDQHKFGHAVVAGSERYPLKVTKNMSQKKVAKRSRIKPFVKRINYNHLMPTRYLVDLGDAIKAAVPDDALQSSTSRETCKKSIKVAFEKRYNEGKNKWFFSKLRF